MKNLKYLLAVAFLGQASYAFAQYEVDALRFSQTQFGGTARTLGIGGANVAVGADLSSLATNPAGLGMYQRSEFSFSPGLGLGNTESTAFGTTTTDARNSLHIGSLGAAFVNRRPDSDSNPWRSGTFALGLTRINDFNQSFRYRGNPSRGQDIFQRLSTDRRQDLDDLAYKTYLTEEDSKGIYVPSDYSLSRGKLTQEETVLTTGSQTQFDFGYGASYKDRLYIGGAIGLVSTRFSSTSTLKAIDPNTYPAGTEGAAFSSLTYRETLDTRGSGINARVGAIYRASDVLRVGASIQTPTYMQLSETYGAKMDAAYDQPIQVGGKTISSSSESIDPGAFDYALTTPFRASGGVAAIIGKHGFISGDVEYVNYSSARLSNDNSDPAVNNSYDFGPTNDDVRQLYHSTVNLRVGGELRADIFRLRAGYARYGDPYKENSFDRTQNYFTLGAGLRQNNFFIDVAGVYSTNKRFYSPYVLETDTPVVGIDGSRYTTTLTAGWTF
ncbi:OmpP1/FadL family transporter [Hymenobacter chitinivorans]|uniref:Outer membrane protein transport protein (OMPP1/FadL/TodX) n=1 Tax=Hymenobacter chitinivorans DSM 11115 TaxID=1121954 RepID=A0A2M9AS04_9BACT|nr:hypothetical protein [Hymenobacter chitinivorans]PJJ48470.1 hypothetical protein CLV45_4178 [Hymenobacter chitinivorans DSM 11115]